jgi:hypothetical protein
MYIHLTVLISNSDKSLFNIKLVIFVSRKRYSFYDLKISDIKYLSLSNVSAFILLKMIVLLNCC